jgi:hypothetical protein
VPKKNSYEGHNTVELRKTLASRFCTQPMKIISRSA